MKAIAARAVDAMDRPSPHPRTQTARFMAYVGRAA
jgi:hypothetical protein